MGHLPGLPEKTNLLDVLKAYPKGLVGLLDFHDAVLRGPSPLSIGERELIAGFVSGLNECRYCYGAHSTYAEAFGIDLGVFDGLLKDVNTAPIDEKLKPILRYVRKLTLEPYKVVESDVKAILDAGWPEEAVADTIYVTALFNFMNRIIFGAGVDDHAELYAQRHAETQKLTPAEREARNQADLGKPHYRGVLKMIGLDHLDQ